MAQLMGRGGRRRRTNAEINMVPFIDVMLVLLIIFMVSAPLLPTGVVDLPTMGKAQKAPDKVIEVLVESDTELKLVIDRTAITLETFIEEFSNILQRNAGSPAQS